MKVDRCVCFQVPFRCLAALAAPLPCPAAELSDRMAELCQKSPFGQGCQMCRPYVRRMLRSGQTVFFQAISPKDEPPFFSESAPANPE